MQHFLVVFDRAAGRVLREEAFADHHEALVERLAVEKAYRGDDAVEIVVLSARSAADLRRTHARYFKSIDDLASPAS